MTVEAAAEASSSRSRLVAQWRVSAQPQPRSEMYTLFSVIIPSHNRADVVLEAVDSVLQQSFEDFELIVVDDGSLDATESVISSRLYDPRVKYVSKMHSGAAETRNAGVRVSSGTFITFLDSDDVADSYWLETFARMIDAGALVGCCGIRVVTPTTSYTIYPRNQGPLFRNFEMKFTNSGSYFLRKDVFDAVGGFDPDLQAGQHTELGVRVAEYCHTRHIVIRNIMEPLVTVRRTRDDHIRNRDEKVFLGTIRFLRKHREKLALDDELRYAYLSVVLVRGLGRPLSDVAWAAVELWKLRPLSLKTYLRLAKWLVVMRLARRWQG